MAVRGSLAKTLIGNAILQIFPDSFIYEDQKTNRIPSNAEDTPLEIKISMTCAKDLVGNCRKANSVVTTKQIRPQDTKITQEEIDEIRELLESLGL